jgi:hypothetical protein
MGTEAILEFTTKRYDKNIVLCINFGTLIESNRVSSENNFIFTKESGVAETFLNLRPMWEVYGANLERGIRYPEVFTVSVAFHINKRVSIFKYA